MASTWQKLFRREQQLLVASSQRSVFIRSVDTTPQHEAQPQTPESQPQHHFYSFQMYCKFSALLFLQICRQLFWCALEETPSPATMPAPAIYRETIQERKRKGKVTILHNLPKGGELPPVAILDITSSRLIKKNCREKDSIHRTGR